jgi:uncharacterized coiled-coil DUF342 family protein
MEELKIQIDVLKQEKQDLENSIDEFSRYGRSPDDNDYEEMIELLGEWDKVRYKIDALIECLEAIISNAT